MKIKVLTILTLIMIVFLTGVCPKAFSGQSCGSEGTYNTLMASDSAKMAEESNCAIQTKTGVLDTCPLDPKMSTEDAMKTSLSLKNIPAEKNGLGICPVMLAPSTAEYSMEYNGVTYYFCCQNCVEAFKSNPQKYLANIIEIKVEAFKYGYSPDPIKVKKGNIVRLMITSMDTAHGFAIKAYNIDAKVDKGETKKIEFLADKAGQFEIKCSVYCGPGHGKMKAKLIVEE